MAITTYTELKSAIADWIHRTDLTTQIVDFITLAETEINTDFRIRLMEADNTVSLTSGARTISLPTGYIEPISLELVISGEDNTPLIYVQPQQLRINNSSNSRIRPVYWTINGATIEFPSQADQTYSLKFRMLKEYDLAATSTNTLLDNYPNIYLYAALTQAAKYTRDNQLQQTFQMCYEQLREKIKRKEGRSKTLATLKTESPMRYNSSNIITG